MNPEYLKEKKVQRRCTKQAIALSQQEPDPHYVASSVISSRASVDEEQKIEIQEPPQSPI